MTPVIDPELKQFASPAVADLIDAVNEHGGFRAAARLLDMHHDSVRQRINLKILMAQAAARGYAPGHFEKGVAPGFRMGKVTVQRNAHGEVERTWERQSPAEAEAEQALREMVAELAEPIRGRSKIGKRPTLLNSSIMTVYKFGDPHFGMESTELLGGDDFDLDDADRLTRRGIDRMVSVTPSSKTCIIELIGDNTHANDTSALTPGHKNPLDVDRRGHSYTLLRSGRAWRYVIDRALEKHDVVIVWVLEGNHDPDAAAALALMLSFYYENNSRVQIDVTRAVFRYHRFGKVFLGAHHGDRVKMPDLPLLMAVDRPEDWGASEFRYIDTGHIHHDVVKEIGGVRVESLRTLAAKDPYHKFKGYRAMRDTRAVVYHEDFGEVERYTVAAAMLEAA